MPMQVCMGATMQCSFGTAPSSLGVYLLGIFALKRLYDWQAASYIEIARIIESADERRSEGQS
jgi:hypothetical protein